MSALKLTGKQLVFANEYLKCLNATEAARRAEYKGNDATLAQVGYENLRKPDIAEYIAAEFEKHTMSTAEVLYRITSIARGDIGDVLDSKGNLDLLKAKDNGKSFLIRKVKSRTFTTEDSDVTEGEVEPYDALRALELLAKYHQLLTTRIQIDDWKSQAIADIKSGTLSYEVVRSLFDADLATQLFALAGVPVE